MTSPRHGCSGCCRVGCLAGEGKHMDWNRHCTSGRFRPSGPDQQDPILFGVGVVVKSWCNRRSALVLTCPWRSGPARPAFAPLIAPPNTPPCAGPLLLQRTGRHPGHLTYRLHITPRTLRSSASTARSSQVPVRCRLAPAPRAMAMSSSYDASGHDLSVLFDTLLSDIIVLSSRSNRAGVVVCAPAT